ncbi:GTP-binding protein gtr2 [Marasmius tenuissimus]|uniref:GTP-binding protein n=1 Tax=Marasmius tenuissimus TaxID=585030 RepID=A0ABR2ZEY6_9AGAR
MTSFPSYGATSLPQRPVLTSTKSSPSVTRTKVLLLGLRRSGKSSIQQVLFNNLPPKECFYLDATMRIVKSTYDTIIPLEIWDCPGNITVETLGAPLSQFTSLIFVIDIRDLYNQPISKLIEFIMAAYHQNPNLNLEVFVHKSEKLHEDDKIENFRQINERVADRLLDENPEYEQMPLNFYLTSIYDHTLHEAFSQVLHKLIDSLPYLEDLLNVFCANSQSPKAFLFDTQSRLYVATDASPVDSATHNLCCDNLAMLNSFAPLYRSETASQQRHRHPIPPTPPPSASSTSSLSPDPQALHSPTEESIPTTPKPSSTHPPKDQDDDDDKSGKGKVEKKRFYPSAATALHSSPPGTTLTCHVITDQLVLIALIPTPVFESRRGLIEYNVVFFREGVQEICDVEREARGG